MKRSTYLGQYTDEVANEIAGRLEDAGIGWAYKQAGFITKVFFMGEWGTRMYVDAQHIDEARRIAEEIAADG